MIQADLVHIFDKRNILKILLVQVHMFDFF
jgi:hypothetical protein